MIYELCIRVHLYVYDLYNIIENHHTLSSTLPKPLSFLLFCPKKSLCFYLFLLVTHAPTFIIKIQNYYQLLGLKNGVKPTTYTGPPRPTTFTYTFIIIFCLNYFINCIYIYVLLYRNIRKNVHDTSFRDYKVLILLLSSIHQPHTPIE
jgi:hypothetical protein